MEEIKAISEEKEVQKLERIGPHTHIRGLGLTEKLEVKEKGSGMVGQVKARKAAGVIVKMVKEAKIAGRGILIAGKPGTGSKKNSIHYSSSLTLLLFFSFSFSQHFFFIHFSK